MIDNVLDFAKTVTESLSDVSDCIDSINEFKNNAKGYVTLAFGESQVGLVSTCLEIILNLSKKIYNKC